MLYGDNKLAEKHDEPLYPCTDNDSLVWLIHYTVYRGSCSECLSSESKISKGGAREAENRRRLYMLKQAMDTLTLIKTNHTFSLNTKIRIDHALFYPEELALGWKLDISDSEN